MPVSRIARRTPDVISVDDPRGEPRIVVAEVEQRLMIESAEKRHSCRARAQELHQEADRLYFKGDYESALVLYHRAARLYPREALHSVAARRTEAAISSAANPTGRLLHQRRRLKRETSERCPEIVARKARDVVAGTEDPDQDVPKILRYLDAHQEIWRLSSPAVSPRLQSRSRTMLRQLNKCVRSTLRDVERAHASGDSLAMHQLSGELVNLVSLGEEPHRSQIQAMGYLLKKQMELGRHDRAVELAARMIFLARSCRDNLGMVEALVFVGKVHLKLGCLDALVRVWERLAEDIRQEAIPSAWLHHDIGRCHLELGNFSRSLHFSKSCLEHAESVKSKKWTIRGQLLSGQSLLKLGRLAEAVGALKTAAKIAEEKGEEASDQSILLYVQSLIDQVTRLLRRLNRERDGRIELPADEMERDSSTNSISKANRARTRAEPEVPVIRGKRENLEEEEDTSAEDERIAQLLERTRALRREHRSPGSDKNVQVPRLTVATLSAGSSDHEENDDVVADSSRTRVIRRREWGQIESDDERTLRPGELVQLSCGLSRRAATEEDARSEVTAKEEVCVDEERPVTYFSPDEDQLTSRSFSLISEPDLHYDAPIETSTVAETKQTLQFDTAGFTAYLRSFESCEFLKQEQPYLESRCNPSGSL